MFDFFQKLYKNILDSRIFCISGKKDWHSLQ